MRKGLGGVVAAVVLAVAAPAHGAVVIGGVASQPLADAVGTYELVQSATAGGTPGYVVPAARGVITAWRMNVIDAQATAQLRLYRDQGGASFQLAGLSDPVETRAVGLITFPSQVPTTGGEIVGLFFGGSGHRGAGADADQACSVEPIFAATPGTVRPGSCAGAQRLNVEAIWEPDSDGDGFGDETQDRCNTTVGIEDGCPGVPGDDFDRFSDYGSDCAGTLRAGKYVDVSARRLSCSTAKVIVNRWIRTAGPRPRGGTIRMRPNWRCTRTVLAGRRWARITCRKTGGSTTRVRFYERQSR